MDPQKSPAPGVAPEGQNDQNEVSVNLNADPAQLNENQNPAEDTSSVAADTPTQSQSDFSTPADPVADPGTSFSPTPVTDVQSDTQPLTDTQTQQEAQHDLAQVATTQAGIEPPADMTASAAPADPTVTVAPDPGQVTDPAAPTADPSAAPTQAEAPATHNDKKVVVILGVVAVVLLAAIAVLFVM